LWVFVPIKERAQIYVAPRRCGLKTRETCGFERFLKLASWGRL
jgi:hypothetical protein